MTLVNERTRGAVVVVGGTAGLGLGVARHYAEQGHQVVVTGRDAERAKAAAAELGPLAQIATFDLARPHEISAGLADVGPVDHLVLAAIDRGTNTVVGYDIDDAIRLVTLKLVGYVETIRALLPRIGRERGSILLFGGQAKDRPYPGSTMVSTVNGGIVGMMTTLAVELKPLRVNSIHPGIVGDSPYWVGKDDAVARAVAQTPTGRTVTMADIVHGSVFLLENRSANGISLTVDGGRLLT
jgi:NAD(P)-dependent dehydrogenase (short-subunit alcohol dehydrogenase family)